MEKIFTLLALTLSLAGFGQNQNGYLKAHYPELFEDEKFGVETFSSDRQLVQLYDSIIFWSSNNGALNPDSKIDDFDYVNNQKIKSTDYSWYINQWYLSNFSTWEYDDNGRLIEAVEFFGYDTSYLAIYQYDNNGNLTFMAKWQDLGGDTLTLFERTEQEFNDLNLLNQKTTYQYQINGIVRNRYTYSYNEDNKYDWIITETGDGSTWVNTLKNDYSYSSTEDSITNITSNWLNGNWVTAKRSVTTYTPSGKRSSMLLQNFTGGAFVNNGKYNWNYDVNDGLKNWFIKEWVNGAWLDTYRQNCTNDSRGNLINSIEEYWEDNQWILYWIMWETHDDNNFLKSHSDHVFDNTIEFIDSTHYYYQTVIGLPEQNPEPFKLYPNPVNSNFTMEIPLTADKIEIYSMTGNLVRTLPVSERMYNIADLPKGIYLLKVKTVSGMMHQKIMKL